jgi:hypothetical protein
MSCHLGVIYRLSNDPIFLFCDHFGFFVVVLFETETHYVTQTGLELKILLPQLSKCWDYRQVPPCPAL